MVIGEKNKRMKGVERRKKRKSNGRGKGKTNRKRKKKRKEKRGKKRIVGGIMKGEKSCGLNSKCCTLHLVKLMLTNFFCCHC